MKRESKSAPFLTLPFSFLVGALFLLSACADVAMPGWMTGEPDYQRLERERALIRDNVTDAERIEAQAWPNLSSVPGSAGEITSQSDRNREIQEMADDHQAAEGEKAVLDEDRVLLETMGLMP